MTGFNIDNISFEHVIYHICPSEIQLGKATTSYTEATVFGSVDIK